MVCPSVACQDSNPSYTVQRAQEHYQHKEWRHAINDAYLAIIQLLFKYIGDDAANYLFKPLDGDGEASTPLARFRRRVEQGDLQPPFQGQTRQNFMNNIADANLVRNGLEHDRLSNTDLQDHAGRIINIANELLQQYNNYLDERVGQFDINEPNDDREDNQ